MNHDPYEVLGVAAGASEAEVREAYLRRLREFPPEREPEAFERIRDAYQALSDPTRRIARVLEADAEPRVVALLERPAKARPAAGLDAWLDLIAEASDGR